MNIRGRKCLYLGLMTLPLPVYIGLDVSEVTQSSRPTVGIEIARPSGGDTGCTEGAKKYVVQPKQATIFSVVTIARIINMSYELRGMDRIIFSEFAMNLSASLRIWNDILG